MTVTGTSRAHGIAPGGSGAADPLDHLLSMAMSEPHQALRLAEAALARGLDPRAAAIAWHTAGIVHRDAGRFDEASRAFRMAERCAREAGDDARVTEVTASHGVALALAGRPRAALRRLASAADSADAARRPRVLVLRAHVLIEHGKVAEALLDLPTALTEARKAGDRLWEARALAHLSWARSVTGEAHLSERAARAADIIFTDIGQRHEAAWTVVNRAESAVAVGDLPRALTLLDEAEARFEQAGDVPTKLAETRCRALLAAGLAPEALAHANAAAQASTQPLSRAELLLVAATAALADDDPRNAGELAREAARAFARHRQQRWLTRARFVEARADHAESGASVRLLRRLVSLADTLTTDRAPEAAAADVLVASVARTVGARSIAARATGRVAARRSSPRALDRASAWLALTEDRAERGDRAGALRAAQRGLESLDEFQAGLGDSEMRAFATAHARDLSTVALRMAATTGRVRTLLTWTERVRATSVRLDGVRPPSDPQLRQATAAARDASRRLAQAGGPLHAPHLVREVHRHETEIRRISRRLHTDSPRANAVDVDRLAQEVGSDALVSLVVVDAVLYAVLVTSGRVSRHEIGPLAHAATESQFARFALRRAAYGRVPDLAGVGSRLESTVLGALGARLPERVTIVPPAALHTLPWGLLPCAANRVLGVAPSGTAWLRARGRPRSGHVSFVCGPELSTSEGEVGTESARYAAAHVLVGEAATAGAAASAMEGARIAHVAAHGTFRGDAPLFSSLQLADGPLYLYDLDRLAAPPHTVVLSACDVGDSAAVGTDEGLGLVTGLLGLGVSAVLASTVPVSDQATLSVMSALHSSLAAGDGLPTAWLSARLHTRGDALAAATAASFTAWGA